MKTTMKWRITRIRMARPMISSRIKHNVELAVSAVTVEAGEAPSKLYRGMEEHLVDCLEYNGGVSILIEAWFFCYDGGPFFPHTRFMNEFAHIRTLEEDMWPYTKQEMCVRRTKNSNTAVSELLLCSASTTWMQ